MKLFGFLREVVKMAFADLAARPLRSILSVTSFSSGIAIAVVLVAAGDGLRLTVAEILRSLGEGQIVATPGRTTGLGGQRRAGRAVRIRYEDVADIKKALPSLSGVAPFFDLRGGGVSSWRYSIPYAPVRAVGHEYRDVRRSPIREGRWFTAEEERQAKWVAVLNEGLRKLIFPDTAAVGQSIQWRRRQLTVVGVMRDEALFPYMMFIPYNTASQMTDTLYVSGVVARPAAGENWSGAVAQIRRTLASLGEFDPLDTNALEIEDNREFTSRVRTVTGALYVLVVTISGVCLLLGGLGVANMMVIAVTERTREIGLRKAIGATPGSIFLQILCEALAIISLGGAVGLSLGAIACEAVGTMAISETDVAEFGFDIRVALFSLASLGLVGVFAGMIPARRAAALPAAEALRWE